jgi:hypothetical protein
VAVTATRAVTAPAAMMTISMVLAQGTARKAAKTDKEKGKARKAGSEETTSLQPLTISLQALSREH